MSETEWTKEGVLDLLVTNDAAVERAVIVLTDRQTLDERAAGQTRWQNGVGWNAYDASYGTYLARWIKGGRHLTGKHLDRARKMVRKYAGQLLEVIEAKSGKAVA